VYIQLYQSGSDAQSLEYYPFVFALAVAYIIYIILSYLYVSIASCMSVYSLSSIYIDRVYLYIFVRILKLT